MRLYRFIDQDISWFSLDFKEGAAEGTFFTVQRSKPRYIHKDTGLGKIIVYQHLSTAGYATVMVDCDSGLHLDLKRIVVKDVVAGPTVRDCTHNNNNTKVVSTYKNMYISNDPDDAIGFEGQVYPWIFGFEAYSPIIPASSANNVIGT